ncbi:hypothetical protein KA005_46655, partial [bacterium]|nr:hypothetical protein [bacterium]
NIPTSKLRDICKSLSRMASPYMFANDSGVLLSQRPDIILDMIKTIIQEYPEAEQKTVDI